MPATDVARTGEPVFIEDPDEFVARYRAPLEARGLAVEPRSVAVVPLEVEGRQFGAVGFTWNGPHDLPADRRAFIAAIARLGAAAMDRARLFDAERRHADELEAVVAAIGEAILVAEPDGTIRASNAVAAKLLGGGGQSVEAFLASLLDADGDPPRRLPIGPSEFRLARRPTSWVEVTSYPVTAAGDEGRGARVIICRDVSAFRQGQALREAFLGLLSHELRTPVTTIYGGRPSSPAPTPASAPATRAEILADVANEADRLYRLVEDLLVLARFDEGMQLGDEPALLQRLVPVVVDQERGRWPTVDFAVEVAADLPAVRGDETSITQVLRNLISNAAKYGDARGGVTVVVELIAEGVVVRVRDDGPGINPLEAEGIFDPFYRSASTAKMAGGAGIGLYVSRRLVEAMHGRIWAASRATGGSEFSVVLPRYGGDADEVDGEAVDASGSGAGRCARRRGRRLSDAGGAGVRRLQRRCGPPEARMPRRAPTVGRAPRCPPYGRPRPGPRARHSRYEHETSVRDPVARRGGPLRCLHHPAGTPASGRHDRAAADRRAADGDARRAVLEPTPVP